MSLAAALATSFRNTYREFRVTATMGSRGKAPSSVGSVVLVNSRGRVCLDEDERKIVLHGLGLGRLVKRTPADWGSTGLLLRQGILPNASIEVRF